MRKACLKFATLSCILFSCNNNYKGTAWEHKPQEIPGKIQCECYDLGGEGISYHDTDSLNNGSGKLNPANGNFLNEFRMKEGVDISYTKSDSVDNNPYNKVEPEMNQLYVGWTVPSEWINYSVDVKKTADYTIGIKYTCNDSSSIEIMSDKISTGAIFIESTHTDSDTVAWRQWHHWNKIDSIATIHLRKGLQVLTLKTVEGGNMNFDYLEFKLLK
jgi:hypothetical protein